MHGFQSDVLPKVNIAHLRFRIDTVGEYFIYEETSLFQEYLPIFFSGYLDRNDRNINFYCYQEFKKFYRSQWPAISSSHQDIYQKGMDKYLDIIKIKKVRIIHAQFLSDALFCESLIKKVKLPLIVNLRGNDLFSFAKRSNFPSIVPYVDKFIAKSDSMKTELVSLGCDPSKIEVIYSGINTDKIIFKPRIPNKESIKILSAGRFVEKKGYEITLKFFHKFLKVYPGAELTLIGEGKLKKDVEKLIQHMGIESNVYIKNYLPHAQFIRELYRYNLFVLPSRTAQDGDQEGIPNTLKEAMASGIPVISTYHSGIPELIKDEETGYLVDEDDYVGIFKKAQWILSNSAKVFHTCINARFYVERKFNVKKTAMQVERLYDYLLMPSYVQSSMDVQKGLKPKRFRVDLHLNKGCNSKCIMCDDWKNNISTSYSRKDVAKTLNQLKSFGVDQVRFHGQEPTLMKDFFSIMKEAKEKGFRIGLKTNALIFTNEKKVRMMDGIIDDLYLSIDSSDERVHNLMRGNKASFVRNISLAKRARKFIPGVQIYFNAVVTSLNYRSLVGLLDLAESLKADKVSFVHLSTNNKEDIEGLKLSKEQFEDFYFQTWPQILKKSQAFNIPVGVDPYFTSLIALPISLQIKKLRQNRLEFQEEIEHFTQGLYGKTFYSQNTCHGVLDHSTVDWEGNVFPCCAIPRSSETAIGNLHQNTYSEIWNKKQNVEYRESILRGECRFKDQCSRSFRETAELNQYFGKEKLINENDNTINFRRNQNRENEYINNSNLKKLVYYSFVNSNIYQEKFKNLIATDKGPNIAMLPCVSREELKNSFPMKDVVPNYFEEDYEVYRTSSCGSKAFLYAKSVNSNNFDRMSESFIHTGMWNIGQPWIKLTSMNCLESQYPLKSTVKNNQNKNGASNVTILSASENFLNEPVSEIKRIFQCIINSKARLIHANPSYLKLLLYRFNKENLRLNGCYAVHSTYETLLPSTRKTIKKYLDCTISNQYGCSEIGPIFFTCSHGKNHLFSDTVHVEVLPVPGLNRPNIGRIAVTHLKNYVMPFVNYLNGDMAYVQKDKKCACGLNSSIMGDIVGREDEMINYKGKIVFPLEIDKLFCNLKNTLQYQVSFKNERFFVKLVPENQEKGLPINQLEEDFKHYFDDRDLDIDIEKTDFILPKRKGKYSTVIVE